MDKKAAIAALSALAQDTRLDAFRLLIRMGRDGMAAGDIARTLGVPPNTLSAHLSLLSQAGLVRSHRNGRSIVYEANHAGLRGLLAFLTEDCCQGRPDVCVPSLPALAALACPAMEPSSQTYTAGSSEMTGGQAPVKPFNVLFLCTGNSARSIMAEAALSRWGGGRFRAFSAGSHPTGRVNPMTLRLLASLNYDTEGLRSKSWDEFSGHGAPDLDFVFTVCDNAAGEVCPVWPGQPMTAHWGVEDPAAFIGPEDKALQFFRKIYFELDNRIKIFASLRLDALDRLSLQNRLREIGSIRLSPEESFP